MWRLAVRDLTWRRRRFVIAVASTALVFAITLILAGMTTGLHNEPRRSIALVGADAWIVAAGTTGPYTTTRFLPAATVDQVAAVPGVTAAAPILIAHAAVLVGGQLTDINIIGHNPGAMGSPTVAKGVAATVDGQVITDDRLDVGVGDVLTVGDVDLAVVGTTKNTSFNFGIPTVFMSVADAQRSALGGQPLLSAIVVKGAPTALPPQLVALTPEAVRKDLHRPIERGVDTIAFVAALLWVVAAGIVGSIVYLTALERTRDFAVLKATGASNRDLFLSLSVQALALSAAAAIVAVVLAQLVLPVFPIPIEMEAGSYIGLVILAVVVATLASAFGLRRAVTVDPALAFGG